MDPGRTNVHESSPLLPGFAVGSDALPKDTGTSRRTPSRTFVVVLLLLYVVFLDLGYELIQPAQTRVLESIFCRQYYEQHDPSLIGSDGRDGVDEKWCKVPGVQGELAMLKGWQLTFDSLGMLIFAVPWAAVADKHGRKKVIILLTVSLFFKYAYIQFICSLQGAVPLRWTWLSAIHTVAGGSVTVATALIYTILSDVLPLGTRVAVFFQVQAAYMTTQFLGSLVSGALMVWSPWIPMLLGLLVEFISIVILLTIPETLHFNDEDDETSPGPTVASPDNIAHESPGVGRWRLIVTKAREAVFFLTSDIRIPLVVSAFIIHMLILNRDILLQYISTRYHVTLARATVLISIRSGLVFLLLVLVLPVVNVQARRRFGPQRSDLWLGRISGTVFTLSFLGLGLAPKLPFLVSALVVDAFGWGWFSFLRSLATSLVESHHVARLNSFIGVLDTIGLMVGSPLLAALFTKGLEFGGPWLGLPFLFNACVVASITLLLLLVKV